MKLVLGSGGHGAVHVGASRRAGSPRNIARRSCCACAARELAAAPAPPPRRPPQCPPSPTTLRSPLPRAPRADAMLRAGQSLRHHPPLPDLGRMLLGFIPAARRGGQAREVTYIGIIVYFESYTYKKLLTLMTRV